MPHRNMVYWCLRKGHPIHWLQTVHNKVAKSCKGRGCYPRQFPNSHHNTRESKYKDVVHIVAYMIKHPDIQSMIKGYVYHPPSDNSSENLERIENTLNQLTIKHPKAKILVGGDFNHMPLDELTVQFNLCKKIDFTTRGDAILDQILTDVDDYRSPSCLPPLLGNETDHCCVHLPGQNITKHKLTPSASHNRALF